MLLRVGFEIVVHAALMQRPNSLYQLTDLLPVNLELKVKYVLLLIIQIIYLNHGLYINHLPLVLSMPSLTVNVITLASITPALESLIFAAS